MDSSTFTAYTLDRQRAARLDRENEIRRRQRERHEATAADETAPARTGLLTRLLRLPRRRSGRGVAAAH